VKIGAKTKIIMMDIMGFIRLFYLASLIFWSFSFLGNASAIKLNTIDLETIVAGVKHGDSLLKSGKGNLTIQPTITEFGKKLLNIQGAEEGPNEFLFAYEGKKVYCEIYTGAFRNYICVFDGEKQVEINKSTTPPVIGVRGEFASFEPRSDLHYWGMIFNKQPIGEYLENNATAILGKEYINKTLCYVIQAKCPGIETVKFWIAPSKAYRVLKREYNTSYAGGVPATVTMIIEYEKSKSDMWFPKSGTDTTIALNKATRKKELMFRYSLTVKDFELNVDVSDLFKLGISPDTEVFDFRTNSTRTAKDAGINN
jgi:hypothetical protein